MKYFLLPIAAAVSLGAHAETPNPRPISDLRLAIQQSLAAPAGAVPAAARHLSPDERAELRRQVLEQSRRRGPQEVRQVETGAASPAGAHNLAFTSDSRRVRPAAP